MTLERWFAKGGLVVTVFIVVVAVIINDASLASSISNGGGAGGGGQAGVSVSVPFSSTPTFTCPSSTAGTVVNFVVTTLTGNITSSTLANCTQGALLNFRFTQDGTGGHTVQMPAAFIDPPVVNPAPFISTKCSYFSDPFGNIYLAAGGCVSDAGYGFGFENAAPGNPPANSCFSWFDLSTAVPHWNCNSVVFTAIFPQSRLPNQFLTGVLATGAVTSAAITQADLPSNSTLTIAAGQTAMPTAAVGGNACSAAATTATATGATTTDSSEFAYASDPTGVLGYGGGTNGGIEIRRYVTTNTMNFKLCNTTASSITPGAISVNWRIAR